MPKRLGSGDVIRVLQAHGFIFVSQKGSHTKYRHATGHTATRPSFRIPKRNCPSARRVPSSGNPA